MSERDQLNLYIRKIHQRLRFDVSMRAAAIVAGTALAATVVFRAHASRCLF
ncbi:MAG: hypothetical protein NVSMB62_21400 [Acidobacteriaceae bacterium]